MGGAKLPSASASRALALTKRRPCVLRKDLCMRLYAATGDAIARIDDAVGVWTAELSLRGSGAQCLAVDPADPDCVYAGLRSGKSTSREMVARRGSTAGYPSPRSSRSPSAPRTARCTQAASRVLSFEATTAAGRGVPSRGFSISPHVRAGAFRRDRGRRTCAGSRRARTTPTCCSWGSSWAG